MRAFVLQSAAACAAVGALASAVAALAAVHCTVNLAPMPPELPAILVRSMTLFAGGGFVSLVLLRLRIAEY